MSSPFAAMNNAGSGVTMASRWMDTLGHNLANINTYTTPGEEPFRAKFLKVAETADSSGRIEGVRVNSIVGAEGDAPLFFDPEHPLADENGLVQGPVIDVAGQMSDLVIASRHYQVNLRVITTAHDAYKAALTIGRG